MAADPNRAPLKARTEEHRAYVGGNLGAFMGGLGLLLMGIAMCVCVAWMGLAKQDSKLYESDNVVCVSQPFAVQCFERKAR